MYHSASKVFQREIFVEDYSRILLLLHMVNIMCDGLSTLMTFVVQVRNVPDTINKIKKSFVCVLLVWVTKLEP